VTTDATFIWGRGLEGHTRGSRTRGSEARILTGTSLDGGDAARNRARMCRMALLAGYRRRRGD
jgi:hypothetical protein